MILPSKRLRTLFSLLSVSLVSLSLRAQTPTFTNVSVHDPSVVKEGNSYYIFGSHMASASSPDLIKWTQISSSPASPNPLIRNGAPRVEFAEALAYAVTDTFWAPDVIKLGNGKFYYYYCACKGDSPLSVLGLAVADSITGPYADAGIFLRSMGASPTVTPYDANIHPNVVDPSVFFDNNGKLWMVYGSYSGGIFILELDPANGLPLPGQGYGKKLMGGNHGHIEGAYIIYSPETSYYYMFLSYGGLAANGGYNIRVARSTNPDGPYLDSAGADLTNVKGSDAAIAPYGVKLMGNWQFLHEASEPRNVSQGYLSPGHCSVHRDTATGKYSLVFHTRFVGRGDIHEVRVHQMYLNTDGWFVAAPQRYAGETMSAVSTSQIPGTFKLINHGKDTTATVKTSTVIALNTGGTITGTSTGTWQLTGGNNATLTLGGTTYQGVFSNQWDDDNQVWTLCFSALSADGTAVWGTRIVPGNAISQTAVGGRSVNLTAPAGTTDVRWQILEGETWTNLSNTSPYSGVTTATLEIANVPASLNGRKYRYVGNSTAGGVTGTPVALAVTTAVFSAPTSIAVDASGVLYVSDNIDHTIRKVATDGLATILAGTSGTMGSTDGTGTAALFRNPAGLALDAANSVFVADTGNSTIRKITAAGAVTTLAGSSGNSGSTDATGSAARFSAPADIAVTSTGLIAVADTGNHTVRQVDSAGVVTTRAGTAGSSGISNGTGSAARFNAPAGIAANATGDLYVSDTVNNTLRKITTGGVVTTLAGLEQTAGFTDGTGLNALFSGLTGSATDSAGNVYVADTQNSTIRKITPAGVVTTVAGLPGIAGFKDGTGTDAWLNKPRDVAVDSTGNLYVADTGNASVRRITPAGVVTTLTITAGTTPGPNPPSGPGGSTPPPASGGGGGGGGGSPSYLFLISLALITGVRVIHSRKSAR
jgi:arabinan endo-1,5-alpha-L-arabinosidase